MIFLTLHIGQTPDDSTLGVDPAIAGAVVLAFLLFIGYIVFRVWRGLKDEKKSK